MVTSIRVYFEGDRRLREGFHRFLNSVIQSARERRVRFRLVAGGATAVQDFMTAMRTHSDSLNILLVDSEGPDDGTLLLKVKGHRHWVSEIGAAVDDEQVHFMVQVMEAWFLADRPALRTYYGPSFSETRLPANPKPEQIPKDQVIQALRNATRNTGKREYHKTRHAPELLALIDASTVRAAAPACARLFQSLERAISA